MTVTAAPSPSPSPTADWVTGSCTTITTTDPRALPCGENGADRKIIKMVPADSGLSKCPATTDVILTAPTGESACARNVAAPHEGAPGKGGGVLRPGDCIYTEGGEFVAERPCFDAHGPGKIKFFLKKAADCHRKDGFFDGHYTSKRQHPATRVICHGIGDSVKEPGPRYEDGVCFRKPKTFKGLFPGTTQVGSLVEVGCAAKAAWGEVVASADIEECPRSADVEISDIHYYPPSICVRRI